MDRLDLIEVRLPSRKSRVGETLRGDAGNLLIRTIEGVSTIDMLAFRLCVAFP